MRWAIAGVAAIARIAVKRSVRAKRISISFHAFRRDYPARPDELSLTILQDLFGFVGFRSLRRRNSRPIPDPSPVTTAIPANSFIGRCLGSVDSYAKLAAPFPMKAKPC